MIPRESIPYAHRLALEEIEARYWAKVAVLNTNRAIGQFNDGDISVGELMGVIQQAAGCAGRVQQRGWDWLDDDVHDFARQIADDGGDLP